MLYHVDLVKVMSADRSREALEAGRQAELAAAARRAPAQPDTWPAEDVVIRLCRADDSAALERLATLSERRLPPGSFVVAELAGELVAAVPLDVPGPALRDPFRRLTGVMDLLELRLRQIRGAESRSSRFRIRRAVRA